MSNKGKRYTSQKPKLNIKKVIAVLFVFAMEWSCWTYASLFCELYIVYGKYGHFV